MPGEKVSYSDKGKIIVPDQPVIPYIEGDGVGPDIWKASVRVFNSAIERYYGGKKKIHWLEVYAGEKAYHLKGDWTPEETIETIREYKVGHQRSSDHSDRRWLSQHQCFVTSEARSLCLYSSHKIYPGNSQSIETAREDRYGGFSGEYRRCLCRD